MVNSILSPVQVYLTPVLCLFFYLDSSTLDLLERFRCEIGRRILKLSKFHATDTIRIDLHSPSVATQILNRKLTFLSKLLSSSEDTLSSRVFKTLAMEDAYSISIVQQCRMLESTLGTNVVTACLKKTDAVSSIVNTWKKQLLKRDFKYLLQSASQHSSTKLVAKLATQVSWSKLWDHALDLGEKGTCCVQSILRELSCPCFSERLCHLCNGHIDSNEGFFDHLCKYHQSLVCNELLTVIISSVNMPFILKLGSKLGTVSATFSLYLSFLLYK